MPRYLQVKFRGETLQRVKTSVMPTRAVRARTGRSEHAPHVGLKELAKRAQMSPETLAQTTAALTAAANV